MRFRITKPSAWRGFRFGWRRYKYDGFPVGWVLFFLCWQCTVHDKRGWDEYQEWVDHGIYEQYPGLER